MIIEDGKGSGVKAQVDSNNRLLTSAVTLTQQIDSNTEGDAYNINTGNLTFSAAGTFLYVKNNEDRDLMIETIIVGLGTGTFSDSAEINIVRNPTGGDLISDATAVADFENRNFGSNRTLSADAYSGKSSGTLTGGDNFALIYATGSSRAVIPTYILLPKGTSIGITFDPKLSSGNVKAYCATIAYLVESA